METFESADAILDFAIAREQEAYEFYTALATKMGKPHISEMFAIEISKVVQFIDITPIELYQRASPKSLPDKFKITRTHG